MQYLCNIFQEIGLTEMRTVDYSSKRLVKHVQLFLGPTNHRYVTIADYHIDIRNSIPIVGRPNGLKKKRENPKFVVVFIR